MKPVKMGVFIPIGKNGWWVSANSPQFSPTFDLNKHVVQRAEHYGMDFALSMVKFRGWDGDTGFWEEALESFTLTAGLAAVTKRIELYASVAILTIPPAILARMAVTIDSIAPGRFGMNLVTGDTWKEYSQMGLWPGNEYFETRYDYLAEYLTIMKELWTTGVSDFKGKYYTMDDCRCLPKPSSMKIVMAGMSERGTNFAAKHADFQFVVGKGVNTPTAYDARNHAIMKATELTGRDVKTYPLFSILAAETDAEAFARLEHYKAGLDEGAITWMREQFSADSPHAATAHNVARPEGVVHQNVGLLVGSYESVARMLDEASQVEGTGGIMLIFDEFIRGMEEFGTRIQPLMKSRAHIAQAA